MLEHVFAHLPITDSTWIFLMVLLIILFAPMILRPLKIPYIIGMILAGVVIGPFGFNILARDKSFELFGEVGLNYIMFLAALEMDTRSLFKDVRKYLVFGIATFAIPFAITFIGSRWLLGYSNVQSLLISCILSSNTLIAYPIVSRYGLGRHKSVSLSVGGTMISLLLSLVIVAALSNFWTIKSTNDTNAGLDTLMFWLLFAGKIIAFGGISIYLIPRITRGFLRNFSDPVSQFIFVIAMLILSSVMAEMCGIEGILGAFLAGLILNRYIPKVSTLMNRIEFVGNALFIPYFLIGVGMLINIHSLYNNVSTVNMMIFMVLVGTLGKGIAAYVSARGLKMPWSDGHIMFGLTSAHAAGAIAIIMVGTKLEIAPGTYMIGDEILNGIVVMILVTCIISSFVTEYAAKQIVLQSHDDIIPTAENGSDDEKILILVKDENKAQSLISTAVCTRNQKLNRGLIALNVVYDDANSAQNQREGRELLERLAKNAAGMDVRMQTQSRLATNIANGITHAFKEYDASEIIAGTHPVAEGEVISSYGYVDEQLISQLNRQIIFVNFHQPLSTMRRIQVIVPSKAHFEPGFYRWVERVARMATNLSCRIIFHGKHQVLSLISDYMKRYHRNAAAEYEEMNSWEQLTALPEKMLPDHLVVIVTARKGTVSYQSHFDKLPVYLSKDLVKCNQMVVFPDQYGRPLDEMTFVNPQ